MAHTHQSHHSAAGRKLALSGEERLLWAHKGSRSRMVLWKMGAVAKPDSHHFWCQEPHHENWEHIENSFHVTWESLKKLQLMAEKLRPSQLHKWHIGSTWGIGWGGKHNNKKIGRWEISGGMCHEQWHLFQGLQKSRLKISSSFQKGIKCYAKQALCNEQISPFVYLFLLCSVILSQTFYMQLLPSVGLIRAYHLPITK